MSTMQREWRFGENHGHFEAPDLLVMTFRGTLDAEGAKRVVEIYREVTRNGPVFVLLDLAGSNVDAAARNYMSKNISPDWFHVMVGHGAGFVQKAVLKSLVIGASLFGKASMELEFANDETGARALIERKRNRLRAKVA